MEGNYEPQASRLQFLRRAALGAGLPTPAAADQAPLPAEPIPRRPLGHTGVQDPALGFGGHHLGDIKTVSQAMRMVHEKGGRVYRSKLGTQSLV